MAVAIPLVVATYHVTFHDQAPLNTNFPEHAGSWTAHTLLFCQNEACLHSFDVADLTDSTRCPDCGGALEDVSLAEKNLLPDDTRVYRRRYIHDLSGGSLDVTSVLSGVSRSSIHKPQWCLSGQGFVIRREYPLDVDIPGQGTCTVRVLETEKVIQTPKGRVSVYGYFAYWFVGPGVETADQWVRMSRMAWERVISGEANRWAYVTLSGRRTSGTSTAYQREIKDFLRGFHPLVVGAGTAPTP